jgi:hypothetical protein
MTQRANFGGALEQPLEGDVLPFFVPGVEPFQSSVLPAALPQPCGLRH